MYVPAITQFFEGFVNFLLYKWGRSAGTRAEIDECVVGDGRAEEGLERARDERGGGCRLEYWSFVFPEKSETCLDEGAEGSGKPRIGSVVSVFRGCGQDGVEVRYQDWSSISNRRSGGMGRGSAITVELKYQWKRLTIWLDINQETACLCRSANRTKVIKTFRVFASVRQPRSAVARAILPRCQKICVPKSRSSRSSYNFTLPHFRQAVKMSLSMPSAPNGGLFKQGYQKYVLFSASIQDIQSDVQLITPFQL